MSDVNGNGNGKTVRRDLASSMADGASYSVMVGVGETYLPAFALALGLGEVAAGLIATVPMLAGGLLQLISPWAVDKLGSHRRWVVACACCQAFSLLLMVALALIAGISPWLVFVPATLYWGAGLATGPAWNAWIERVVPRSVRVVFFAQRTRVSHVCVLLGLFAGGVILRNVSLGGRTVTVFAVLFGVAAASRLFSALMLARHSEPTYVTYLDQTGPTYREVIAGMRQGTGMRLLVFLLAVQVAVYVSGPYFTPFMLGPLKLSYFDYMVLLSCGFLGKILSLPWAGRFAKRAGARQLLWIGGLGIVPLSALWLVSNSFPFLIVLQIFGGMAWAAYELAMLLLFFESIPREQRVILLSLYNLGNAAAMVTGALIGALVMHAFADGWTAYMAVFGLSSLARLAALLLIPKRSPEPHPVEPPAGLRTIAVRPMAGIMERPILSGVPDEADAPAKASVVDETEDLADVPHEPAQTEFHERVLSS